ncbi:hypothetical protein AAVH_15823 [Aphelenchoides avenae]|nr:hypothetical protein AAVH_15823 [Aphelenchus avenae]
MSPMKVVLFVFVGVFAAASALTAKEQVVAKSRNLLTPFPTVDQTIKIWDKLALDTYNMKTIKEMADGIVNTVLGSLNGDQLVKGLQVYNALKTCLGSAMSSVIDRASLVASNNLQPLLDQIQTKTKSMKAAGQTQAACFNSQYSMTTQFLTADRVKTIATRVKAKMTTGEWACIKKNLNPYTYFTTYGL